MYFLKFMTTTLAAAMLTAALGTVALAQPSTAPPADEPAERPAEQPAAGDAAARGADSPQAVFEKFFASAAAHEWRAMYSCLTDDTATRMTLGLMAFPLVVLQMQEQFLEGDEAEAVREQIANFAKILENHNLDPDELRAAMSDMMSDDPETQGAKAAKLLADVRDRAGLFADVAGFLHAMDSADDDPDNRPRLTDVKIDGDTATGTAHSTGDDDGQPIEFRRVNGKWLLHLSD